MEKDEIRQRLVAIEPDMVRLAHAVTPADNAAVAELMRDEDARTRANAFTLQSLVDPEAFIENYPRAAADPSELVRMQALISIDHLTVDEAMRLGATTRQLLDDPYPGVRKRAITASRKSRDDATAEVLTRLAATDELAFIRDLARDVSANLR